MTASWQPDPYGRHELRYWDGAAWTEHVSDAGAQSVDVVPADTAPIDVAPAAQDTPAAAPAATGDPYAGLSGDLVGGEFTEVEGSGPRKQNSKMLRVSIGEPFMAKQGSMVAFQGNVDFAYKGAGGLGKLMKKAMTGEGVDLMTVSGQGDVFLGDQANDVHILQLNNGGISVSGKNVLAFSSSLSCDIERVKGGSIAAGGLFNTTLRGTGWVAITTDGTPVVLNAGEAPTFADTNAVVAWSLTLQTSLKSGLKMGDLIGRGAGEAFQIGFHGQGFVIVQPSEGVALVGQTSGGGGIGNLLGG